MDALNYSEYNLFLVNVSIKDDFKLIWLITITSSIGF